MRAVDVGQSSQHSSSLPVDTPYESMRDLELERERITNFIIACRLIVRNPSPLIDNTPTSHNDSLPRSAGFASLSRADDLQECFYFWKT